MYYLVEFEEVIPIPPEKMEEDPKKTCWEEVVRRYVENPYDRALGIVISLVDLEPVGEGVILHGDPNIYQRAKIKAVIWKPENKEVFDGLVKKVLSSGVIVDFGAGAGFLHISQIGDDKFDADPRNGVIRGRKTKWTLKVGEVIRTRIIGISEERTVAIDSAQRPRPWRISLTCRSAGLGKLEWIREGEKGGKKKGGK